jgi:hypothetical protein
MKKFAVLLAAIGFTAAAPLASADTAQLELMPKVDGIEMTRYVADEGSTAVTSSEEFYNLGNGGVSPQ